MMMYKEYSGEFRSRQDVLYRVEIWNMADAPYVVGELAFPASQPLTIEWNKTHKEDVICGSVATLTILSESDRQYIGLYSDIAGNTRLDVYRNNVLYWRGSLDTEFYEEPYQYAKDYPVTLTFSDFGILSRKPYSLSGIVSLNEILTYCLQSCNLSDVAVQKYISTQLNSAILDLSAVYMQSANFFDEDGEAMSLQDVLIGILQPLAIRIVQKAGIVYLFDLNALCALDPSQITWLGNSSTLSADVVYNNIVVTWSPYVKTGSLNPDTTWNGYTDPELVNRSVTPIALNGSEYLSYPKANDYASLAFMIGSGFTLWFNKEGDGVTLEPDNANRDSVKARVYKMLPQSNGSDSEGVAVCWPSYGPDLEHLVGITRNEACGWGFSQIYNLKSNRNIGGSKLFSIDPIWLPPCREGGAMLLLTMELLMDCRFNPFSDFTDFRDVCITPGNNTKALSDLLHKKTNYVYIPIVLSFHPSDGGPVLYWSNRSVIMADSSAPIYGAPDSLGEWIASDTIEIGFISYYDPKDRTEACGILGWRRNKNAVNPHSFNSDSDGDSDGQYIPYPPASAGAGELRLAICRGWWMCDAGDNFATWTFDDYNDRLSNTDIPWLLTKIPTVEVIKNSTYNKDLDDGDIEYHSSLNSNAKESLTIDTICGTKLGGALQARGTYLDAQQRQITSFTRENITAPVEELLIATMHSQYSHRCVALSGLVDICNDLVMSEVNQPGKKMVVAADVQDLQDDSSDIEIVEIRKDQYVKRV